MYYVYEYNNIHIYMFWVENHRYKLSEDILMA